jgi:DMSO/TMAO reductase YedYZ molybdopterin-dependent catalytic subunit
MPRKLLRRELLGGALAGLALAACNGRRPQEGLLGSMARWNDRVQGGLLGLVGGAAGAPAHTTEPGAFPSYHIAPFVPIKPDGWRLRVGGLVARPKSFDLDELMRLPRTDLRVEHHCVEGWSAVADWHGVRLADLAEAVGADRRADFVDFRSFDVDLDGTPYWSSWDRESAFHRQTVLAYGMNGKPLTPGYGAPLRLYSAVKLGYKNVKYLTEVNFLDHATSGFWEESGYEWFAGT